MSSRPAGQRRVRLHIHRGAGRLDRVWHHPAGTAAAHHGADRRHRGPRGRLRRLARVRLCGAAVLLRAGARKPGRSLRAPPGTAVRPVRARVRLPRHGLRAGDRLAVRRPRHRRGRRRLLYARLCLRSRHQRPGEARPELRPHGRGLRARFHPRSRNRRTARRPSVRARPSSPPASLRSPTARSGWSRCPSRWRRLRAGRSNGGVRIRSEPCGR